VLRGLALPTAVGVGSGLWLFAAIDQQLLLKAFSAFIIGCGLWEFLPRRPEVKLPQRALAGAAGVSGGLVATLFGGMAGPFYVIYLRALQIDKRRFRASMSSVLLCLGLVRAAGYGGLGFYDRRVVAVLLLFVPVMGLAMFAGDRWHARLDEARFGKIVAALLALSGCALLFK
jgi:uncharacterized membrane protein YfcA